MTTQGRESEWQAIETAPRDGTLILCWRRGLIDTAWWQGDRFGGRSWTYPEWDGPTHWMEFPEPPEGEEHHDIRA